MRKHRVFWLVLLLTGIVYGLMLLWTLPTITDDTGGLLVFDLRPFGYSYEEAQAFLAALSPKGNEFYRTVQRGLDTLFPAFEAISIGWAIFLLLPVRFGIGRFVLALAAVPGMIFDYLENTAVAVLLRAGSDGLTPQMVKQASFYSQMKAGFVAFAFIILILVLGLWFVRRKRS